MRSKVARPPPKSRVILKQHMSQETGIGDYTLLYSTKEYKKKRVEYFATPSTLAVETEGRTGEKAR